MRISLRGVFLLAGSLLLAAGCSTGPVESVKDPGALKSGYKTFRWIGQDEAKYLNLQNPDINYLTQSTRVRRNPEAESRVRTTVERQLEESGYSPAPNLPPDFYVTFYAKAPDQEWVSSWEGSTPSIWDVPVVIFPDLDRQHARTYTDGTVYLVMYDAKTRRPSWSGNISRAEFGRTFSNEELTAAVSDLVTNFNKSVG